MTLSPLENHRAIVQNIRKHQLDSGKLKSSIT